MPHTISILKSKIKNNDLSHTALADGTGILLDINGGQVIVLNQTGELLINAIINNCDSIESLSKTLTTKYKISEKQAEGDTLEFLAFLKNKI